METRCGFYAGGLFWPVPTTTPQELDENLERAKLASPLDRPPCDNRRDFRLRLVVEYYTSDERNRRGISTRQFRAMIDAEALTDALNALLTAAGEEVEA